MSVVLKNSYDLLQLSRIHGNRWFCEISRCRSQSDSLASADQVNLARTGDPVPAPTSMAMLPFNVEINSGGGPVAGDLLAIEFHFQF
jgi:hypothetical protein